MMIICIRHGMLALLLLVTSIQFSPTTVVTADAAHAPNAKKAFPVELIRKKTALKITRRAVSEEEDDEGETPGAIQLTGRSRTMGKIMVGTPAKEFTIQFDTGSSALWIFGKYAKTAVDIAEELTAQSYFSNDVDAAFSHSYYNEQDSSSFTLLKSNASGEPMPFVIKYLDGDSYNGFYAKEVIAIDNNYQLDGTAVGIVQKVTCTTGLTDFDGMFGLGIQPDDESADIVPPFVRMADGEMFGGDKLFSLYLSSVDESHGELRFGGVNTKLYSGEINYVPRLTKLKALTASEEWLVNGDTIRFGYALLLAEDVPILMDSGATDIYGPYDIVGAIIGKLSSYEVPLLSQGNRHFYDFGNGGCDRKMLKQLPDLEIMIGEEPYTLKGTEYFRPTSDGGFCLLKIVEVKKEMVGWVFGEPFLQKYYTVFDYGEDRMGFALAQHGRKKCSWFGFGWCSGGTSD